MSTDPTSDAGLESDTGLEFDSGLEFDAGPVPATNPTSIAGPTSNAGPASNPGTTAAAGHTSAAAPTSATGRLLRADEIPAKGTPLHTFQLKIGAQYGDKLPDPNWRYRAIGAVFVHMFKDPDSTLEKIDNAFRLAALDYAVSLLKRTSQQNNLRQVLPETYKCYAVYDTLKFKDMAEKVMSVTQNLTKDRWSDWEWFKRVMLWLVVERTALSEGERIATLCGSPDEQDLDVLVKESMEAEKRMHRSSS